MLVDLDKFIESLMWMWNGPETEALFGDLKLALDKQGLAYKDGKIIKTQRRISAESKEIGDGDDEKIKKGIIYGLKFLERELSWDSVGNVDILDAYAWLEKQGEQKPANIEPKFGIGWWITSDNVHDDFRICKVVGVDAINGCYSVESIDGNKGYNSFETFDKLYHEWTIQDAKGGDIISAEPTEGWSSPFIAIYKCGGIDSFDSYCIVDFDGEFSGGFDGHYVDNIHPATKEQRNILFSKMHEDGYTFDFEKKELKEIEDEPQLKVGNFYECIKSYYYLGGGQYWFDEGKVYFCEKDGYLRSDPNNLINVYDCKNWQSCFRPYPYAEKATWKPSDEQMEALEHFIIHHNGSTNYAKDLEELRIQLKKLKGE